MMTRRRFLALLGGSTLVGVGAVSGAVLLRQDGEAEAAEPSIRFGMESCAHCGMIIDDRRFAAAWTAPGGESRHFDDMSCLFASEEQEALPPGARHWVADFETHEWLDATTANYVVSGEIRSPMASGIAAFRTAEAAERTAGQLGGELVAWRHLPDHVGRDHH
jgi:copper chaperone NosL